MKKREKTSAVSLSEYLQVTGGLSQQDAVNLFMPVAAQLKSMHDKGNSHLQVSPESIKVSGGAAVLLPPDESKRGVQTPGFSAPEQYRGRNEGRLTDIYSFCAVLYFACTGNAPADAQQRQDGIDVELENSCGLEDEFMDLLQHGMVLRAQGRPEDMQDLIDGLSRWYTGGSASESELSEQPAGKLPSEKKEKAAGKFSKKWIALLAAAADCLAVLAVLTGIHISHYKQAVNYAVNGDYDAAEACLSAPWLTRLHDSKFYVYLSAGRKMDDGDYEAAAGTFESLDNYQNAKSLALQCREINAEQYLAAGNPEGAEAAVKEMQLEENNAVLWNYRYRIALNYLQQEEYAVASEKFQEIIDSDNAAAEEYQAQSKLDKKFSDALQNMTDGNYKNAIDALNNLSKKDYEGADEMLLEAEYRRSCDYLESGKYDFAINVFDELAEKNYKDSAEKAKECHYLRGCNFFDDEQYTSALREFKQAIGYNDTETKLNYAVAAVYSQAVSIYNSGKYSEAKLKFSWLDSNYENVSIYLTLCELMDKFSWSNSDISKLKQFISFADAAEIAVNTTSHACSFLNGTWKTSNGSYYFTMSESDSGYKSSYNLPNIYYSGYFYIEDGRYYVKADDSTTEHNMFFFNVFGADSMYVYCYSNGQTYTMYRK